MKSVCISLLFWLNSSLFGGTTTLGQPPLRRQLARDDNNWGDGNFVQTRCEECMSLQASIKHQYSSKTSVQNVGSLKLAMKSFCTKFLSEDSLDSDDLCNFLDQQPDMVLKQMVAQELDLCDDSGVCTKTSNEQTFTNETKTKDGSSIHTMDKKVHLRRNPRASTASPSSAKEHITFVQISDVHMDSHYRQGSASFCKDKICCHQNTKGSGSAGRFGDYRCDSVEETVELLMNSIKQLNPKPDFFIYVGDSPPHSTGHETLQAKLTDNKAVNDLLVDNFRSIGPIYPTLGNHDLYPENVYFSKGRHCKTILNKMADEWSRMFEMSVEQQANVKTHGYYTVLVKPGLRVLSINSLYAYTLNPLAFLSLVDPLTRKQKSFIKSTLTEARSNSEKVILMSHMKPGYVNTHAAYSRTMERIVKEFSEVIILMLFGHEHTDTFVVSTDLLARRHVNGAFLAAPSVTPYIYYELGTNPSYRVFTLDAATFKPLDYDQYYVNLEQANDQGSLTVEKHYSFTEEYNVPDLSPASFSQLANRITDNWEDYQKFERNRDVLAARRKKCSRWNKICRRRLTCEITSPTKLRYHVCVLGL